MKSVLTWNEDEHSRKRNAKNVPDRNETPLTASAATSLKLQAPSQPAPFGGGRLSLSYREKLPKR